MSRVGQSGPTISTKRIDRLTKVDLVARRTVSASPREWTLSDGCRCWWAGARWSALRTLSVLDAWLVFSVIDVGPLWRHPTRFRTHIPVGRRSLVGAPNSFHLGRVVGVQCHRRWPALAPPYTLSDAHSGGPALRGGKGDSQGGKGDRDQICVF
jgi:hypothetical protein